jgi:hypothetical protein
MKPEAETECAPRKELSSFPRPDEIIRLPQKEKSGSTETLKTVKPLSKGRINSSWKP